MGKINSIQVTDNAIKGLGINVVTDLIPTEYKNEVQPTFELNNQYSNIVKRGILQNGTAVTLWTTPTDADFYITGATLSVIKDATATSNTTQLYVVIGGANIPLLEIAGLTLTAQANTMNLSLTNPLKIDRGSIIQLAHSTNVATIRGSATVVGYLR